MRRRVTLPRAARVACVALVCSGGTLRAQDAQAPYAAVDSQAASGGTVFRFDDAEYGTVRVWRPKGYAPRTAGVVVYVHGHATTVDAAWTDHRLGDQFEASRQNALFIIPESPQYGGDRVRWPRLESLFAAVEAATGVAMPSGPLVVVGHSGAFKQVALWLEHPRVRHLILLDALYGNENEFRAWHQRSGGRLTIVAFDTRRQTEAFRRGLHDAVRMKQVPQSFDELTPRQRRAGLLIVRSQYSHMGIVTTGKVIPVLLRLSALRRVGERAPAAKPRRRKDPSRESPPEAAYRGRRPIEPSRETMIVSRGKSSRSSS